MFNPRYGVSQSTSTDFETASRFVYAWFHYASDARKLAEATRDVTVWDLVLGREVKRSLYRYR